MLARIAHALAGDVARHEYATGYLDALEAAGVTGTIDRASLPSGPRAFVAFLENFSKQHVAEQTLSVYAPDAWLNDTLKTTRGASAIRDYFTETAEMLAQMEAQVLEATGQARSWFFRWTMTMRFESLNRGQSIRSIGASHVVFDAQDRVLVHQDYWDSGTWFFLAVPVAGQVIDRVKRRL